MRAMSWFKVFNDRAGPIPGKVLFTPRATLFTFLHALASTVTTLFEDVGLPGYSHDHVNSNANPLIRLSDEVLHRHTILWVASNVN